MDEYAVMPPLYFTYMNRFDVEALNITDDEILEAIEGQLATQGRGEAVIEPRMHLEPKVVHGHFNVLRGSLGGEVDAAGVKVVSDFYDNYKHNLPSELALLLLFDRRIGVPKAIIDASAITDMRTGAVTAVGAKYLARRDSRVLGHIGARGTAYWNVRLMDKLFDFEEIRVHSRRKESRDAFAGRLERDLGKKIIVTEDWESCARRRHHCRGLAARRARAATEDGMDQEGRSHYALWNNERGRALARRHRRQIPDGRFRPGTRRTVRRAEAAL